MGQFWTPITPKSGSFLHADQHDESQKLEYRALAKEIIRDNPDKGRAAIRQLFKTKYDWLRRHDKEWLYKNLPAPYINRSTKNTKVDWLSRDKELSKKAKEIAKEMIAQTDKSNMQRITMHRLGQKLSCLSVLRSSLDKLPKTKAVIEKYQECNDNYRVRRIKAVVKKIQEDGKTLVPWRIQKHTGIYKNISKRVEREIRKYCK